MQGVGLSPWKLQTFKVDQGKVRFRISLSLFKTNGPFSRIINDNDLVCVWSPKWDWEKQRHVSHVAYNQKCCRRQWFVRNVWESAPTFFNYFFISSLGNWCVFYSIKKEEKRVPIPLFLKTVGQFWIYLNLILCPITFLHHWTIMTYLRSFNCAGTWPQS